MQTQLKDRVAIADIEAVREFLLNGAEIPREESPKKKPRKIVPPVQVHHGITRARGHSLPKQ